MDILRKKEDGRDEEIKDVFAADEKPQAGHIRVKAAGDSGAKPEKSGEVDVLLGEEKEPDEIIAASSEKSGQAWDAIIKWSLYLIIGLTPLFFMPWGIMPVDTNKQFFLSVITGIAIIAWLAKSIASGRLAWKKSLLNPAIVVLLVFWGVSSYFSASPFQSLGFGFFEPDTFLNLLKYAVVFFLIAAVFGHNGTASESSRQRNGVASESSRQPAASESSRQRNGVASESSRQPAVKKAVYIFLLPVAVLAVFVGFKFLNINLLPARWDFAQSIDFNPVGTLNGLAMFLGAGLVLIIGLLGNRGTEDQIGRQNLFWKPRINSGIQTGLIIFAIIIAIELLLINFRPVWWALAGVMIFLTADGLMREMQLMRNKGGVLQIQKIILPVAILAVSALLLLVRLPISDVLSLPAEVSPSQGATYQMAKEVLKSKGGVANLFGSGPATFTYDYGLYRSADLNQTVFWGVRFSQGASFFLTALAATGILGVLSLLLFIFTFGWQTLRSIKIYSATKKNEMSIVLAAAVLFLIIGWFFYQANFTLLVSAFILLGLLVASREATSSQPPSHQREEKEAVREISLLASPQRTLIISLLLIVFMVGAISALYLEGQKYIAGLYYSAGINAYNQKGDFSGAFAKITKAINLNASKDLYWRTLSQMFLVKTSNILNDQAWQTNSAAVLEDLRSQFQLNMSQAVSSAQRAKDENPADSLNWSNLGFVYENVLNFVNGGEKFLIEAYEKSTELEPSNPALQNDLGRAHLAVSDKIQAQINQLASAQQPDKAAIDALVPQRNGEWQKAIEELEKSVALKADYSPPRFLLVQVYSRQGELKKAILQSEAYRALNVKDPGAAFQLGFLYYKNNQMAEAKAELERAVSISPDYSNARYFLGLIYDAEGNKQGAKEQFKKIAELNPENAEVKKILENLNAGKGALETISPPGPAPEQRTTAPVSETGGASSGAIK
jgi:tetratricopeptide (TPR) repeat protein